MKKLESMEIRPAENGGHTVRQEFKREVSAKKMGDMYMDRPKSEEHVFGATEDAKMLGHVAENLGVKASKGDCPMCGGGK